MAGLLDEFKDGLSETLSAGWNGISEFAGGLLEVDPELQAARDAKAAALKEARLTPDEFGNTPNAWMYNTERSTSTNPIVRIAENYLPNLGDMYTGSSEMIRNPKTTTKMFTDLGVGGVLNLSGGLLAEEIGAEQREMASQFADTIKTQFGSWENIGNMILDNPVDALGVFVGAGMSAAKLAQLAKNPALKPAVRNTLVSLLGEDPMDSLMSGVLKSNLNPGLAKFGESKLEAITYAGNNQGAIFGKLDMSKIGSNSGTKKQGHGLYVSESKDTGKHFARRDNEMMEEANAMAKIETLTPIEREIWDRLGAGYYPDTIRKDVLKNLSNPAERKDALRVLKDVEDRFDTALNQLYEIDLSDEAIKSMIRREKLMKDQPKIVQDLMKKHNMSDKSTGKDFYESLTEEFADQIGGAGAERAATAYLNENNIPGMKFLDELSSDAAKYDGTPNPRVSNYVLYNTDITKILKRQDIPIELNTATEVGASLANPMIAQHNLSEVALQKHLEANGIPMPSLATSLVNKPVDAFGEISLLGSADMVTPNKNNLTYPTDMYSGRSPGDRLEYKDVEAVLDKIDPDKLRFFANEKPIENPEKLYSGGGINRGMTNREYINNKARRNFGLKPNHTGLLERQQAMVDQAIQLGYDPFKYNTFTEAMYKIDNDLLGKGKPRLTPISTDDIPREKLLGETIRTMTNPKGYRTPTGKERADVEYSAETALKVMKKKGANEAGAEGFTSVGQTRAIASEPFKNLQEMKDNRGLLQTNEDMIVQQSATNNDLANYIYDVNKEIRKIMYPDANPKNKMGELIGKKGVALLIEDVLKKGYLPQTEIQKLGLSTQQVAEIKELIMTIKTESKGMKADYFETKPNRIVEIAEFKGAIIPEETKPIIIELLKKSGIKKILTYGTDAERKALFKKFPELNFIGLTIPTGATGGLLTMLDEEQVN